MENASPALNAGIKAGDILLSIDDEAVAGIRAFSDVILEYGSREVAEVKLLRKTEEGMKEIVVEVILEEKK